VAVVVAYSDALGKDAKRFQKLVEILPSPEPPEYPLA
jgi:hypothetical protein